MKLCFYSVWSDVDIRNGGQVYFREILDELQLNMIGNEIRLAFSNFINFRPTWAYIITWYKVAPFDGILFSFIFYSHIKYFLNYGLKNI